MIKIYSEKNKLLYIIVKFVIFSWKDNDLFLNHFEFLSIEKDQRNWRHKVSQSNTRNSFSQYGTSYSLPLCNGLYCWTNQQHKICGNSGWRKWNIVWASLYFFTFQLTDNFENIFFASGGYAVQTFFLISSWLLSYQIFLMSEKEKKLNMVTLILVFINRYIR